ncbi:hypothetical protein V2G26_015647 [Clonostachys chloroleuca]
MRRRLPYPWCKSFLGRNEFLHHSPSSYRYHSICYELPGNIVRCWARSLDEKDLHRHKGRQASRAMLPDLLKGVSGKRPHQTVVKADRPSSSIAHQAASPIKQHRPSSSIAHQAAASSLISGKKMLLRAHAARPVEKDYLIPDPSGVISSSTMRKRQMFAPCIATPSPPLTSEARAEDYPTLEFASMFQ